MNYGQLKSAVAGWANRSDITALMGTFLELAEQRIYNGAPDRGIDQLRLSTMLTTVSPFAGTLPANCLQIERISTDPGTATQKALAFRPLEAIATMSGSPGTPAFYSLRGSTVVYGPTFTNPVELLYFARFATPVADADSNWLLDNASGVYLYAMLIEVAQYLRDDALLTQAAALYTSAMSALQANDSQDRRAGSTLRVTTDTLR